MLIVFISQDRSRPALCGGGGYLSVTQDDLSITQPTDGIASLTM